MGTANINVINTQLFQYEKLPYDAEVEYIESTGTQYLSVYRYTGSETSVSVDFEALRISNPESNQAFIYSPSTSYGPRSIMFNQVFASCDPGGGVSGNTNVGGQRFSAHIDYTYPDTIRIETNGSSVDRTRAFNVQANSDFIVFHNNVRYNPNGRLYRMTIWIDGVKVRDLIPVRFTNELGQTDGGLYDRVSKQLFKNQGTGNFSYGNDKQGNQP